MNKKFYGTLLLGTLLLGSTIVSCKDYDDDIDNLQNQITQLATKADMQSEVSKLQSAVATAQAAAENKAAAAEQAAKDAAAKAQAAADAAAAAQGKADAAATVEALNQVAADAAAAAKAAEDAKAAAEAKAAELEAQLAELQALAATLVSTKDFEAAKKELNDKYAELAAKIGETTGVTGMTGINLVGDNKIDAGYGVWAGVHNNMTAAEWDGPKAETINAIEKGTKLAAWDVENFTFSVNPTDFDASKIEAFAIVNQFDEVAPIAFGTPKAVTRAAAGAWTLPVLGNAIYGEKAAEFEANFKNANNQDGSMATLVAGQFAGALKSEFCKVTPNVNASQTTFSKDIAIDEIDGTAVLKADDATKVLDAYITKIKTTFNGNVAHDSVVYKLAYTGTTLTYDAEAVKKFMSKQTEAKTITVEVKQINLNGYIHTAVGTITFLAKEAAKPVVLERIQLDQEPHTIVPIVWNKSEGKNVDNQKVTVSILPALQKWGIDLSKTKEEATIHWNHTDFTGRVEVIPDSVYYLNDDQTPVYLKEFVETATLTGEEKDKKKNAELTLEFTTDYGYKTVADSKTNLTDDVDAAFNGNLIYIPVKMTGKDTDNGVEKTVEYSVVVPVKFTKINISDYYQWNGGKPIVATAGADLSGYFKATATKDNDNFTTNSIISLNNPIAKPYNAAGVKVENNDPTTAYVVPSVTVSGQLGTAYRKAIADADEAGYASEPAKTASNAQIKLAFMNAVSAVLQYNLSAQRIYQSWMDINPLLTADAETFKWVVTSGAGNQTNQPCLYAITSDFFAITTKTIAAAELPATIRGNVNEYNTLIQDGKYTINGLTASVMGRDVELPGLEVAIRAAQVPAVGTINVPRATKLNKTGVSYFYNSEVAAGSAANFDGKFTLRDKNNKTVVLTSASTVSITDGFPAKNTTTSTEIAAENLTVSVLNYTDGAATPAQQYGIKIDVKAAANLAVGNTVKIPLTITNVKVANLPDSEPQTLKVELTIVVK